MSDISIKDMASEQKDDAAQVLAQAFVTNPLHIAAFGASQLAANEAFFRIGLAMMKGSKVVAMDGSRVVGVIHWVYSPDC
jgi:hypothetical protein